MLADGLLGHLWYIYDSDEFNNTALVDPADISVQRPTYPAYRAAAAILVGVRPIGRLEGQASGIEGYRFARGEHTITAFWSDAPQLAVIPAPAGVAVECIDRDGGAIMCDNIDGSVTLPAQGGPTYVVEL